MRFGGRVREYFTIIDLKSLAENGEEAGLPGGYGGRPTPEGYLFARSRPPSGPAPLPVQRGSRSRAGKARLDAHRDGAQSRKAWLSREAAVRTNWPLLRKATWFRFSKEGEIQLACFFILRNYRFLSVPLIHLLKKRMVTYSEAICNFVLYFPSLL